MTTTEAPTKAAHTPGPWSDDWIIRGASHIDGHRANGEPIPSLRRVVAHVIDRDEEAEANARLIAAAPEMLEALQTIMDRCGASGNSRHDKLIWTIANAAIQKARGGQ